ncbi:MAG: hypothetical protein ACRCS9_00935 [Hyphomicrobium sp.]
MAVFRLLLAFILSIAAMQATPSVHAAAGAAPFTSFAGRWTGEGRLMVKGGEAESVTCRVTYFVGETGHDLKQTVRCASAGGKVEIQAALSEKDGQLSGTWNETIYVMNGDLAGALTPRGLRVTVKGTDLNANMDVIVKETQQIIEIQFFDSALVGLTLMLKKG